MGTRRGLNGSHPGLTRKASPRAAGAAADMRGEVLEASALEKPRKADPEGARMALLGGLLVGRG